MKLYRKSRSTNRLCLAESILLNVLEEDIAKKLWNKLGNLYQSKSMVNKLLLWISEHLNAFNIVISQLLSMDIKIIVEEKCISLLCSLPNSWNNLVILIGRNNATLNINNVVAALLLEELRRKTMKG